MLAIALTTDGWLDGLPKSQSESIEQLVASGKSEEEVGELWLSRTGSNNTLGFGVGGPIQSFYANVKKEFVAFVCGDEKYNDERAQAVQIWNGQGKVGLVSMVAAVVASTVGLAAAAVVPVIALLFSLASKIGLNAFCAACNLDTAAP
ncbi:MULTISPECIES: hypothetical protein [Sphingobium]|uniref:hypothetical protein n=1 Tax=Sphingobium TaxID=165695 RepID=UPI00242DFBE6|nr:hypothetical protein [Sphingobium yanoikuyae]